jgi:myosin heavy subunit
LRHHVGITDEGMNGIIKVISALLIVGNMGFMEDKSGIKVVSRKFHEFPDALQIICEDLLDLGDSKWVELQNVSKYVFVRVNSGNMKFTN